MNRITKFILLMGCSLIACIAFLNTPVSASIDAGNETVVLDYPTYFGNRFEIPHDNPLTKTGVYLGRLLFYEPLLSANNQLTCEHCHQQKLAFTDGKAFSEGVDHSLTTRNAMSLSNLLWVKKFFWDGRVPNLESQAEFPMTNVHEMGQTLKASAVKLQKTGIYPKLFKKAFNTDSITGNLIVKALSQFERTLISANSKYDQYLQGHYQPTAEELNGMELFNRFPQPDKQIRGANCAHCHNTPKTFADVFHNNGLDSFPKDVGVELQTGINADRGRFRVPTLRNIALTAPYMHDGRFKTLEEVLEHYSEHVEQSASLSAVMQNNSNVVGGKSLFLTKTEKENIIAFLKMLTDSNFITDPRFSNPHLNK